MTTLRLWGLALLLTHLCACSAALKWDPNGLACDGTVVDGYTDFCLQGYSCEQKSHRCVRDNSLALLASCSQSRQCGKNDVCPVDFLAGGGVPGSEGIKRCAPGCNFTVGSDPFYTSSPCKAGYVCMPYLDSTATNPKKALVGACQRNEPCTPGGSCSTASVTAGTCVSLGEGTSACLTGCEITWGAVPTYSDNCDSLHSCQIVGEVGKQQFACTYNGANSTQNPLAAIGGQEVQERGAACSVIEAPCASGDVCAPTGICAQYCLLTANQTFPCPTNQTCCPLTTFATSQTTGYCSASCR